MSQRIFAQEWRDCLKAHYQYVIRENDGVTLRTLVKVLHAVGFTDDDLSQLRIEATMRADAMPDDYVPEEVIAQAESAVEAPLVYDVESEPDAEPADDAPPPDPTLPRQLSLF